MLLDRQRDPGDEAAAGEGDHHRPDRRQLVEDLERDGALSRDDVGIVEGVNVGEPPLFFQFEGTGFGLIVGRAVQDSLGTVPPHCVELDGIDPKAIIVLAEIIQHKLKNTKIVVLGLLPRNINETGINYVQKIGRINRQLDSLYASSEVIYRDIGADLTDEQGVVGDTIMPDGLHLNGNGYGIIGPKLRVIIDELW